MLILSRKEGETVLVGDDISITITRIERDSVRIAFRAPREVVILREELVGRVPLIDSTADEHEAP